MTPDGDPALADGAWPRAPTTRASRWARTIPSTSPYSGASSTGGVAALDAVTGAVRWTAVLPDAAYLLPIVAGDGTVYVPTSMALAAVDKNGNLLWAFPVGDEHRRRVRWAATAPSTSRRATRTSTRVNADGSLKWVLPVGQVGGSPAIGADGTLYIGTSLGLLAIGCTGGSCAACVPDCAGKRCGPDGCGSLCGACAAGDRCDLASRSCQSIDAARGHGRLRRHARPAGGRALARARPLSQPCGPQRSSWARARRRRSAGRTRPARDPRIPVDRGGRHHLRRLG